MRFPLLAAVREVGFMMHDQVRQFVRGVKPRASLVVLAVPQQDEWTRFEPSGEAIDSLGCCRQSAHGYASRFEEADDVGNGTPLPYAPRPPYLGRDVFDLGSRCATRRRY